MNGQGPGLKPWFFFLCVLVINARHLQTEDKWSCLCSSLLLLLIILWSSDLLTYWLREFREEPVSINWPAPCWLHHMGRSACNSQDRPGHSARELERRAAGDILICAAMCKGMHLQPGSVPVIRPAVVFWEERRSRKTRANKTRPRKCYWLSHMNCLRFMWLNQPLDFIQRGYQQPCVIGWTFYVHSYQIQTEHFFHCPKFSREAPH